MTAVQHLQACLAVSLYPAINLLVCEPEASCGQLIVFAGCLYAYLTGRMQFCRLLLHDCGIAMIFPSVAQPFFTKQIIIQQPFL